MPKGGFCEIFAASPGYLMLAVDYKFIELVTLAAVCEARYGRSVVADVIRAGRDPHAYSAAVLVGRDPDEFLGLRRTDPGGFKHWRQMAKPLNFGIPGGLGAASLVTYARRAYGVEMGLEQAEAFRRKLSKRIYPEWGQHLAEDPMAIVAGNLGRASGSAGGPWTGSGAGRPDSPGPSGGSCAARPRGKTVSPTIPGSSTGYGAGFSL